MREEETLSKMNIADGYWRIIFFQIRLLNLLGIFEENFENYVVQLNEYETDPSLIKPSFDIIFF